MGSTARKPVGEISAMSLIWSASAPAFALSAFFCSSASTAASMLFRTPARSRMNCSRSRLLKESIFSRSTTSPTTAPGRSRLSISGVPS